MTSALDEFDLDIRIGVAQRPEDTIGVQNNSLIDSWCDDCGTTIAGQRLRNAKTGAAE